MSTTQTSTPELDAEQRTVAMVLLLAEITTQHERNAVTRIALRAGFMWRCFPCKTDHYLTTGTCSCGAHRPADLPG